MNTNEDFYRSIGNMLAENLNGCSVKKDKEDHKNSHISGSEALKAVEEFLSKDFIRKSHKKIEKLDGKVKMHLSNDLKRYEFFSKNLGMVVKAIDSIDKCIKSEKDDKQPKELINLLKKNEGLISRIFNHLISVLDDENVFKKENVSLDLLKEQKVSFKKYRVNVHEKSVMESIMNINAKNNEEVKEETKRILEYSYFFLTEEAVDLFLY